MGEAMEAMATGEASDDGRGGKGDGTTATTKTAVLSAKML
jgi:hypothetical protein